MICCDAPCCAAQSLGAPLHHGPYCLLLLRMPFLHASNYRMCAQWQVDAMSQENGLLRRILIAHAKEMTEAENVSDNICTLAGDLLQLLTQGQLASKQPDLDASRG